MNIRAHKIEKTNFFVLTSLLAKSEYNAAIEILKDMQRKLKTDKLTSPDILQLKKMALDLLRTHCYLKLNLPEIAQDIMETKPMKYLFVKSLFVLEDKQNLLEILFRNKKRLHKALENYDFNYRVLEDVLDYYSPAKYEEYLHYFIPNILTTYIQDVLVADNEDSLEIHKNNAIDEDDFTKIIDNLCCELRLIINNDNSGKKRTIRAK